MKEPLGRLSERLDPQLRSRGVVALLLIAAALIGIVSAHANQRGVEISIRGDDALEHAVMARRLARGEGFSTTVVYPAELRLGADASHPAVRQPPLWPLVLAAPFAVLGAEDGVARATTIAIFGLLVAIAAALAGARGGLLAGVVAALAVATTTPNLLLAIQPVSATLFAVLIALVLWLCASGAPAFAVGLACALAYLTRYSGILLLPAALVLVFARRRDGRAVAWCLAGFALVAAPWWIRNLLIAGNPFYSLQTLALWIAPGAPAPGVGLLFEAQPELSSQIAQPLVKLGAHLPFQLKQLPFASVNLAAFAGLLLGCARRDAFCVALAAVAFAALLIAGFMGPGGAEVAPYFPALIALGAAAWMRYGSWLRAPALALVLAAPLLPMWPREIRDLRQMRTTREYLRDPSTREVPGVRDALRRCLGDGTRVIAQAAPRIAWQTEAIALYAPSSAPTFWQIVEEQDVAFAQRTSDGEIEPARFAAEFSPRPDCGPDLFERRRAPR